MATEEAESAFEANRRRGRSNPGRKASSAALAEIRREVVLMREEGTSFAKPRHLAGRTDVGVKQAGHSMKALAEEGLIEAWSDASGGGGKTYDIDP